jgi:cytochrome bd-type quinol oxidase subunit 2
VDSQLVTPIPAVRGRRSVRSARALAVLALGPLAALGGVLWALAQPYRVTLLHPRGESFWWLAIEPPLLVIAAGLAFWLVVARPLVADLEEHDAAAR